MKKWFLLEDLQRGAGATPAPSNTWVAALPEVVFQGRLSSAFTLYPHVGSQPSFFREHSLLIA